MAEDPLGADQEIVRFTPVGGAIIVEVLPRRIFLETAEKFRERILQVVQEACADVVLDLRSVSVMNSTALGTLIVAHDLLKKRGRKLVLASPGRILREVLERMRLDTLFTVCDTLEDALATVGTVQKTPR